MACRIECRYENSRLVVRLAGRLSQAHVPALLQTCAEDPPPIVELEELLSADAVGLDALLRLEHNGSSLIGLPQWLRLKLDSLAHEGER